MSVEVVCSFVLNLSLFLIAKGNPCVVVPLHFRLAVLHTSLHAETE